MEEQKRDLVFLSYAHDDLKKVREIYEGLKKRKVEVWFDKVDLEHGKWKPQIEKQIPKCRYFIFCVSEASIKKTAAETGFVEEELQTAWEIAKTQDEKKLTIVPIRLEDFERGYLRISTYHKYDLFPDIEKGLDKLAVNIGGISFTDSKAKDVRKKDEKLIESLAGKADVLLFSGEYNKALTMYEAVINIYPDDHVAWTNKGTALAGSCKHHADSDKLFEAIKAYNKAIEIKPDYHEAWYNRGLAIYELEHVIMGTEYIDEDELRDVIGIGANEHINAYDKAIELKPDFHHAWLIKGHYFFKHGNKYALALAYYDKAIKIKPDCHYAYYYKGESLYELGKYKKSIKAYDKAIKLKPDNPAAWDGKGLALDKLGKYEAAISAYDKAIELEPDYYTALYGKWHALYKLGRHEEAYQAFKKAEELKKRSQEEEK